MFIERREREWADLQNRALHLLENTDQLAPRDPVRALHPLLRLWVYPSYEAYLSWTVFRSLPNAEPETIIARIAAWDRPYDARRMREPIETPQINDPTFVVRDHILPPEAATALNLERKFAVTLATARDSVGLDGTSSGLQTYGFMGGVRLSWWQNGPPEWREIITWTAEIRQYLTDLFGAAK